MFLRNSAVDVILSQGSTWHVLTATLDLFTASGLFPKLACIVFHLHITCVPVIENTFKIENLKKKRNLLEASSDQVSPAGTLVIFIA